MPLSPSRALPSLPPKSFCIYLQKKKSPPSVLHETVSRKKTGCGASWSSGRSSPASPGVSTGGDVTCRTSANIWRPQALSSCTPGPAGVERADAMRPGSPSCPSSNSLKKTRSRQERISERSLSIPSNTPPPLPRPPSLASSLSPGEPLLAASAGSTSPPPHVTLEAPPLSPI